MNKKSAKEQYRLAYSRIRFEENIDDDKAEFVDRQTFANIPNHILGAAYKASFINWYDCDPLAMRYYEAKYHGGYYMKRLKDKRTPVKWSYAPSKVTSITYADGHVEQVS